MQTKQGFFHQKEGTFGTLDDDNDDFDDDHHHQGTLSGDIHFDDDEDWTVGSERGTDVIQVDVYLDDHHDDVD